MHAVLYMKNEKLKDIVSSIMQNDHKISKIYPKMTILQIRFLCVFVTFRGASSGFAIYFFSFLQF